MTEHLLIGLASIIIVGIGAQWLASVFKWPSIVLLLGLGFIAGPVTRLINPDEVLGPLLMPMVSISVAIILFEGGLGLKLYELKKIGKEVFNLVSIGLVVNWMFITLAAHYILGLRLSIALLLGSILIVTGPTVILPLLRHVRPSGKAGSIVKWEGIVIDPIGAVLAVLVYEYIVIGQDLSVGALVFFLKSILIGAAMGALGAWLLLLILRKYLVADYLHGAVALMFVITVFISSNIFHHESGLFAVIVMGIILGSQRKVEIKQIVSFKENLGILIISTLFIILAARLDFKDLSILNWNFLIFLAVLIFVARPAAVFVSMYRSGLDLREKLFIAWMAPRGIVAAAIVSILAYELSERGTAQAEFLVPVTFLVIIATVVIYGLSSFWVAQRLGLARNNPQGVLFLGAHKWGRFIAKKLQSESIKVMLIDTNATNVARAQEEGLEAYEKNILNQDIEEGIDLNGIGRLLTLTANDEANSLAVLHSRDIFGRSEVYQLYPRRKVSRQELVIPPALRGRYLFNQNANFDNFTERFTKPDQLKVIHIAEDMTDENLRVMIGAQAMPLFLINEKGELKIFTVEEKLNLKKGSRLIYLA